jgi:SAM-dependent methyltransferase
MSAEFQAIRPVHPFPARMAPSIFQQYLSKPKKPMCVLDPMAGSGTTVVAARLHGHKAVGFDTDPLALLIARTWSSDIDPERLRAQAIRVVNEATDRYHELSPTDAYPPNADAETRAFIRFWFDRTNRRQLTALSGTISQVDDSTARTFLWCALSRLIITKQAGASLAMDVSHSRPHKVFDVAPIKPLKQYLPAVDAVLRRSPFSAQENFPRATVQRADARMLPLGDESVDLVITSPPYLNAIDYLRGHKLSLVWMGHKIEEIRNLRSGNIGTECSNQSALANECVRLAMTEMGNTGRLSERFQGMLARYVSDMNAVLSEVSRVLKDKAGAVLVVGDSTIRGTFVRNSRALIYLGRANGLTLRSTRRRPLLENRRYLPPPEKKISGEQLRARMKEEVILTFCKTRRCG